MPKRYVVKLTAAERERVRCMVHSGRDSARVLTRARVLLKCDEGCTDEEAAEAVDTSLGTLGRVRKRFCTGGLDAALSDRPQPPRPHKRKIDGEAEARLVTLACSTPPDGRESWTVELLADRMVRLKYVDTPGQRADRAAGAQKSEIKPWLKDEWVIPPDQSAEFVWHRSVEASERCVLASPATRSRSVPLSRLVR